MLVAKNGRSALGRGLNSLLNGSYDEAIPDDSIPQRVTVDIESDNGQNPVREASRRNHQHVDDVRASIPLEDQKPESIADNGEVVTIKGVVEREARPTHEPEVVNESTLPISKETDEVDIDSITPNPDQPRTNFKREELEELAQSIQKDGLLQPILVRAISDGTYQIIAGERRWQASKLAGLEKVPIRIKEADDDKALELALIENIQRSDLNPIEEAYGYRRMMERLNMTQAEVAQAMSKGRSTVANALRLLELPEEAQQLLFEGKITAGHARAILSIPTKEGRERLTKKLVEEKLTVREAESMARLFSGKKSDSSKPRVPVPKEYKKVARTLKDVLDTNVRVKSSNGKNKIEIEFKDESDLERLFRGILASNLKE